MKKALLIVILALVAIGALGWFGIHQARKAGLYPRWLRPARPYYEVDQAFAAPRAFPRRFTFRAVVVEANAKDEKFTVMDVAAFAGCNGFTCGLYYIPLYTPLSAARQVPGSRTAVQFSGKLPKSRDLVFVDGRLVRSGNEFEFVVHSVHDGEGRMILRRIRRG